MLKHYIYLSSIQFSLHRILHIVPTLDRAGTAGQLLLLARGLPRDHFENYVCSLSGGGSMKNDFLSAQIPVTEIGKRWPIDPLAFLKLQRHLAHLRPDIVQTWTTVASVYGLAAARAVGVPCTVACERRLERQKSSWQVLIDRRIANSADRFVICRPADHMPSEHFRVIPSGVLPARPSDLSRGALLDQLQLPADAKLIGVIGQLRLHKRVKDLIWSADLLRVLHDNLRLLVIGDGPERSNLERFARLASDLEHIHFLGCRDDVWRIMPHLDVLWNGSDDEGQPQAVMEAMAAGVPVVASDIPGNRELVTTGETGFLVPIGGRAARARVTNQLLTDTCLARRLSHAAQCRMAHELNAEQMVNRYAALYSELLNCK